MERVDLAQHHGTDRQRAWRHGWSQGSFSSRIVFGRLHDGRWFAERYGRLADADDKQLGACAFGADEQGGTLALRLAYRWMRDSGVTWTATPAAYDAHQQPVDGLPWVLRGAEWVIE